MESTVEGNAFCLISSCQYFIKKIYLAAQVSWLCHTGFLVACVIWFFDQGWNPGPLHWEHRGLAREKCVPTLLCH